ncbi:hypothetical protein DIPPA_06907 [Diplonema papillatum]|nr:hypothetical protein DIPPA_06907 [Diplonema papillatum]
MPVVSDKRAAVYIKLKYRAWDRRNREREYRACFGYKDRWAGLLNELDAMRTDGWQVGIETCNAVLRRFAGAGKVGYAERTLAKMAEYTVNPNITTHLLLLNATARSDQHGIHHKRRVDGPNLLQRVVSAWAAVAAHPPQQGGGAAAGVTLSTYNSLVRALCTAGHPGKALHLIRLLEAKGVAFEEEHFYLPVLRAGVRRWGFFVRVYNRCAASGNRALRPRNASRACVAAGAGKTRAPLQMAESVQFSEPESRLTDALESSRTGSPAAASTFSADGAGKTHAPLRMAEFVQSSEPDSRSTDTVESSRTESPAAASTFSASPAAASTFSASPAAASAFSADGAGKPPPASQRTASPTESALPHEPTPTGTSQTRSTPEHTKEAPLSSLGVHCNTASKGHEQQPIARAIRRGSGGVQPVKSNRRPKPADAPASATITEALLQAASANGKVALAERAFDAYKRMIAPKPLSPRVWGQLLQAYARRTALALCKRGTGAKATDRQRRGAIPANSVAGLERRLHRAAMVWERMRGRPLERIDDFCVKVYLVLCRVRARVLYTTGRGGLVDGVVDEALRCFDELRDGCRLGRSLHVWGALAALLAYTGRGEDLSRVMAAHEASVGKPWHPRGYYSRLVARLAAASQQRQQRVRGEVEK